MKILWVKSDFLYPPDTGGKIRSYNILKQLGEMHEVSYLCLTVEDPSRRDVQHLKSFCQNVECLKFGPDEKFSSRFYLSLMKNLFSPHPYVISKYRDTRITDKIQEFIQAGDVDIILCDFLEMAINCLDISAVRKVLFQHNVETEIWRRHFKVSRNPLKKAYLYIDYRKYFNYERMACGKFDDVFVVSESDGRLLEKNLDIMHTTLIPTGVDIEYFRPGSESEDSNTVVFVGSMDWLPNQDAVEYFVDSIYPLIKSRKPKTRFYVVGRRPPEKIKNLEKADPSIKVTGTVDDVRPYVDKARVYIVPIRIGGGTRIKIYEAMAQKKAVVSTTVGAEGLPLTDGKHIIIKDQPDQFAEAVCSLMENAEMAGQLGENARKFVTGEVSWEKIARKFSDALEGIVNQRRGKVPAGRSSGESGS
jgi:sugar transferase (PEP-CTERM/EpsH1 system associated)